MRLTISGPPGSGKTTVCQLLSERTGMDMYVFGRVFRELAAEKGLSLAELGRLAEEDFSVDRMIDGRLLDTARQREDIILESRLAAHLLTREGIPAFRVYLDASVPVRAERIGHREGESAEQAEAAMMDRAASEADRYRKYYGIDIQDRSVYDLVLDTGPLSPEEIVDIIVKKAGL
ncbi:MAG: (d)CMP kinase [Candidatus Methanomethylophilaceae archaeon]|jgi:predicted cytidylate kinase